MEMMKVYINIIVVIIVTVMMMMMVGRTRDVKNMNGENEKYKYKKCGCSDGLCCSEYGYCGRGDAYCGIGCREGPCYELHGVNLSDIVTPHFFDSMITKDDACAGKTFYTRQAFLEALKSYPQFATMPTLQDSKREIAAAFAHFTHETGQFCHIEEIDGASKDYCDDDDESREKAIWPCVGNKRYHGRGPIQLSWNFNYGPAGVANGFDGLKSPETVATNAVVSFKTALWYWVHFVRPVLSQGFGATIRAINGPLECDGANPLRVRSRLTYYTLYCSRLGVHPAHNLSC